MTPATLDKLHRIIDTKLSEFGGDEAYFSALDAELVKPENLDIVLGLFTPETKNVVVSGRFGRFVDFLYRVGGIRFDSLLIFNGSIRKGDPPILQHAYRLQTGGEPVGYTFIDDSFYLGRTADGIDAILRSTYNGYIKDIRVAYDGSQDRRDNLVSLYRYHT